MHILFHASIDLSISSIVSMFLAPLHYRKEVIAWDKKGAPFLTHMYVMISMSRKYTTNYREKPTYKCDQE